MKNNYLETRKTHFANIWELSNKKISIKIIFGNLENYSISVEKLSKKMSIFNTSISNILKLGK